MEHVLTKIQVKKGGVKRLRALIEEVRGPRRAQAEDAMRRSGIQVECSFIEESEDGAATWYVYKHLEDLRRLREHVADSPHPFYEFLRKELLPLLESLQDLRSTLAFENDRLS